ncbi:UDP-3-O-(3-hydroxymyristoyl)glucosamine N-acyltransferase [Alkanindiges illinoisensis]|uniref:UDP-3-O-acylglucosamine N-acyltransferase n=1 Tax=Alkanindiges illinoisensis TaxID=197183 RepID=A0A4Y7XF83_9GAMM|nr:UDP-3-O-(3-hydroxymyristoyl)glucosamine N-acyltransferase [Alkanindiges illinoisensis]TEU30364.1 UDP-3-O-(3-hydroxymyristoyl)glucosamine N-acyltransferase [Alkanindiges illinoisensis]
MVTSALTLGQLAARLNAELIGNPDIAIQGLASLQHAKPWHLAFLSNSRYKSQLADTQAGAVLIRKEDMGEYKGNALIVPNPYAAFAGLSHLFDQTPKPAAFIHPTAVIAPSAIIDATASIGPYVVIEDEVNIAANVILESHVCIAKGSAIGKGSWLDKHVTVQHHCQLGERVRVHAGTVIGADGFGFAPHEGQWYRIAQLGRVIIGDDVRIGANCTIDRGALDDTTIGNGVIIDNLVQIAHNVQIGDYTAIAANVGIAGSASIGKHCIIGGASGIAGHLSICDHVNLTGMAMITKSINQPGTYSSGTSFAENSQWKKMVVRLRQLADVPLTQLIKQIEHLQARVEQVESRATSYPPSSLPQDD